MSEGRGRGRGYGRGEHRGGGGGGGEGYRGRGGGGGEGYRGRGGGGGEGYRGRGGGGGEGYRGRGGGGGEGYRGRGGGGGEGYRGRGGGGGEGYRGRGGFGGGRENQEREKTAIADFAAKKIFNCAKEADINLFPLSVDKNKAVYIYTVSYALGGNPDLQDRIKEDACLKMLGKLQKENKNNCTFDLEMCVSTGQKIITPERLEVDDFSYEFTVFSRRGQEPKKYKMTIGKPEAVGLNTESNRTELNSIIGKAVQQCYSEKMGAKYVDLRPTKTSTESLATFDSVVPKVVTTTLKGKEITALQLDVSVSVASRKNCLAVMDEMQRYVRGDTRRAAMERFMKKKVCSTIGSNKGLIYTVVDLVDKKANQAAGLKKNPEQTYVQYFYEKYKIQIRPDQTLFECKTTSGKKVLVPPEVLFELTIDEKDRRLLPILCSLYPNDRSERIKEAVKRLKTEFGGKASKFLEAYGISFEDKMLKVNGFVLPPIDVMIPSGNNGYRTVPTLGENLQQGFLRDLKCLKHSGNRRSVDVHVFDKTQQGQVVLKNLKGHLDSINAPLQFDRLNNVQKASDLRKITSKNAFVFAFLGSPDKTQYRDIKTDLVKNGILSQVVAKDLTGGREAPIVMAVAQQVAAKEGKLNWLTDVKKLCPSLSGKLGGSGGLLIIGADIGRDQMSIKTEKTTTEQDIFTVAFVAFFARGTEWSTYCNHYNVSGRKRAIFTTGSETESLASEGVSMPSELLSEKMGKFLDESRRHFADKGLQTSAVLIIRGCSSEGELLLAKENDVNLLSGVLKGNVPWAVVAAQRYQHTRFSTQPPNDPSKQCNVPRGFVTSEGTDKRFGAEAFFMNGANCTLGHARSTLYVVLQRKPTFDLKELQTLIYGMCFMYPNKTDGLPLPLPLKCASEYARKFVNLPVDTLRAELRSTLHYL